MHAKLLESGQHVQRQTSKINLTSDCKRVVDICARNFQESKEKNSWPKYIPRYFL